jgi:hypothetical protein
MRILLIEYVCGGGWTGGEIPTSLYREGWLMLSSVLKDLAQVPDVEVVTTWDFALGSFPLTGFEVHTIHSPTEFHTKIDDLIQSTDAVMIIAPESDHVLEQLTVRVRDLDTRLLSCYVTGVKTGSNKFLTHQILSSYNIPSVQTELLIKKGQSQLPWHGSCVIKPTFGAGSIDHHLVHNDDEWNVLRPLLQENYPTGGYVVQPYIQGQHLSLGLLIDAPHRKYDILPLAQQFIDPLQKFAYRGGMVPIQDLQVLDRLIPYIRRLIENIPGLNGYVGLDILWPEIENEIPLIVEINPRMCTSYLGYRELYQENLMERLLSGRVGSTPFSMLDRRITWSTQDDEDHLTIQELTTS